MATLNKLKRKRESLAIDLKKSIIEASKTKKVAQLAKDFKRSESTIKTVLKDKDKILQAIHDGIGGKRSTLKGAKHSDLEKALLKWLKKVRSKNVAVDSPILKAKATKLTKLLKIDNFNASNGWLENFKDRHGIVFKQVHFLYQEQAKKSVQTSINQFFK